MVLQMTSYDEHCIVLYTVYDDKYFDCCVAILGIVLLAKNHLQKIYIYNIYIIKYWCYDTLSMCKRIS